MRPAGATLWLFAQWLRPTTIHGGTDFLCLPFPCPGGPVFAGFRDISLWTRQVTFLRFITSEPEFLSFFSVALWTCP
jgi:hypothetical protein